jgi:hypothetical protein
MALVLADRVRETTTTTGTGTVSLAGPVSGFQGFSTAIGNANTTYYTIADAATGAWEVGLGTYTSSGSTLARTTILSSSNAGAAVNFAAGTKDVFVTQPAERALYLNGAGTGVDAGAASFTANGVVYASSTSALATGSALTFDGTYFTVGASSTTGDYKAFIQKAGGELLGLNASSGTLARIAFGNATATFGSTQIIANAADLAFITSSAEKLRLTATSLYTASGVDVGVGTPTPQAPLQVRNAANASIAASSNLTNGTFSQLILSHGSTYFGASDRAYQLFSQTDGSSAKFAIQYWNGSTYSENLTLTAAGNLGVGTDTPTAKLDVAGTAKISGAVTLSGGTANGVAYLNGSKVLTTGSALTFDGTTLNASTITENSSPVVVQSDIGTAPNEIPLNQYLGTMAYQDGTNYFNVGMTMGFRNRIINGAMVISQRGTSFTPTSSGLYTIDRWITYASSGTMSVSQSSDAPTGFNNSLLWTTTSGGTRNSGDFYEVAQYIEGYNTADLGWGSANAKTITISFFVKSSVTGAFGIVIRNASANRNYVTVYSIFTANTWENKTITIPGDTGGTWGTQNNKGIEIWWDLGSGSTYQTASLNNWINGAGSSLTATSQAALGSVTGATWQLTGVQVEVGTQATPFDVRPYGTELALCQRYGLTIQQQQNTGATTSSTDRTNTRFTFPVTMRAAPTASLVTAGSWIVGNDYSANYTATTAVIEAQQLTPSGGRVQISGFPSFGSNFFVAGTDVAGTAVMFMSAEL